MTSPSNAVASPGRSSCSTGLRSGSSQALPLGVDCGRLALAPGTWIVACVLAGAAGSGIVCITVVSKIAGLGFPSLFSSGGLLGAGVGSGMGLTAWAAAGLGAAGAGVGAGVAGVGATCAGAPAAGASFAGA